MVVGLGELRVSNDSIDDAIELAERIKEDGYLFFKKLQNPDFLWQLRLEMLTVIRDGGWLQPGSILADGVADPTKRCTEGDSEYTDVYHEVYKLQAFHEAAHSETVLSQIEKIIGKPVLAHPQKIARIWFPQFTDHTTPAHQDFVHFQGSYDTYTCWTPIGDCPIELGGLAILPGSHKQSRVLDHHFSLGAGALAVDETQQDGRWLTTNYEIGRLMYMKVGWMKNMGLRNTRETSQLKWYASEAAFEAANQAIQIHGAYGYSDEYDVERFMRNVRATTIYEGTSEVQQLIQAGYALGYRKDGELRRELPSYDEDEWQKNI